MRLELTMYAKSRLIEAFSQQELPNVVPNIFFKVYVSSGFDGDVETIISSRDPVPYNTVSSNMLPPVYDDTLSIVVLPVNRFRITSDHVFTTPCSFGFLVDSDGNIAGVIVAAIRFKKLLFELFVKNVSSVDLRRVVTPFDPDSPPTNIYRYDLDEQSVRIASEDMNVVYVKVDFIFYRMSRTTVPLVVTIS